MLLGFWCLNCIRQDQCDGFFASPRHPFQVLTVASGRQLYQLIEFLCQVEYLSSYSFGMVILLLIYPGVTFLSGTHYVVKWFIGTFKILLETFRDLCLQHSGSSGNQSPGKTLFVDYVVSGLNRHADC